MTEIKKTKTIKIEPITKDFDLKYCNKLSIPKQIKYFLTYFIPLNGGDHIFISIENGRIKKSIVDTKAVNVYLNRLPEDVKNYYFKKNLDVKTIVSELNKPEFYDNKINMVGQFKHKIKPYASNTDETKKFVEVMLNHIREVYASCNEEQYNFIVDWFAYLVQGGKNKIILYLKGMQGLGKSTFIDFIRTWVIGEDLSIMTGSEPLRSKFNMCLLGKLLVQFEELENFSMQDWMFISSRLKMKATGDTDIYEQKGVDSRSLTNINNYILLSNHDSVKDEDGRRFLICDVSNKYIGNSEYFKNIYNNCFNDEVGQAMYNFLLERDLKYYNHSAVLMTESKKDAIINRMPITAQFIKHFVLIKEEMYGTVQEIHDLFKSFSSSHNIKNPLNKIEFNKNMSYYGIKYYTSSKSNKYKKSYDELLQICIKHNLIHELDEIEIPEEPKVVKPEIVKEEPKVVKPEVKKTEIVKPEVVLTKPKKIIKKVVETETDTDDDENEEDDLIFKTFKKKSKNLNSLLDD